jgi:hypothetical protein
LIEDNDEINIRDWQNNQWIISLQKKELLYTAKLSDDKGEQFVLWFVLEVEFRLKEKQRYPKQLHLVEEFLRFLMDQASLR